MKIGILTFHRACNYGAFLQSYALCNRLREEGFDAEIIDFRMKKEEKRYSIKWSLKKRLRYFYLYDFEKKIFNSFQNAYKQEYKIRSKESLVSDSLEDFQNFVSGKYDIIISGSDEVWKLNSFRGNINPYWLVGDLGAKKFSYAASSRSNFNLLDEKEKEIIKNTINSYEFIGVRDVPTLNSIKQLVENQSISVNLCPDPTLIYDFSKRLEDEKVQIDLCKISKKFCPAKKTILLMTEDKNFARRLLSICKNKYNMISVFVKHNGYINISELMPLEWAQIIRMSDLIISSYFHAICFSIGFNKPFIAFGTPNKSTKVEGLLSQLDLLNFYYSSSEKIDKNVIESKILSGEVFNVLDYSNNVKKITEGFDCFLEELKNNENMH